MDVEISNIVGYIEQNLKIIFFHVFGTINHLARYYNQLSYDITSEKDEANPICHYNYLYARKKSKQ